MKFNMKKFGVERYVTDYRVVEYTNEKGKIKRRAEYIGQWYVPLITEQTQRRMHIVFWIVSIIVFLVNAGALMLPYAADDQLYVVLPVALSLFPGLYLIMALFAQPKIGRRMERMQYEHAYLRIGRSSVAIMVLDGVGTIGAIIYDALCLAHKTEKTLGIYDALFLGAMLLMIGLSVYLFITARKMEFTFEENMFETEKTEA